MASKTDVLKIALCEYMFLLLAFGLCSSQNELAAVMRIAYKALQALCLWSSQICEHNGILVELMP